MYNNKKILGIITARGGSKGIPRKNIVNLGGKPLIAWTIEAGLKSKYIDKLVVSTEDEEIAIISKKYGAEIPFLRPMELAQDDTSSVDAVMHMIDNLDEKFDYLILLQPTSPFRTNIQIDEAIEKLFNNKNCFKCLNSVSKIDFPIQWIRNINDDGSLYKEIDYDYNKKFQRQAFEEKYRLNGAIYIIDIYEFKKYRTFELEKTLAFEMDEYSSIDIDNLKDLQIANLLEKGGF